VLKLQDVHCHYGNIEVLKGINLEIGKGEIVALIGANGAGKTTTLKAISGLIPVTKGTIRFQDQDIANLPAYNIVSRGLAHVPEGRQVFPELSVWDNLLLGGYSIKDKNVVRDRINGIFARFPRLKERMKQAAGTLSGGEQQMLAIGRALISGPQLLLMDEPSMGLSPKLVGDVFEIIAGIRSQGTTIFLVEQNAHMALKIADRAYVIQTGQIVLSGTGLEITSNAEVRKAYLAD